MALRVLLADESPTIKKVMQISLQDFGVDLKTVQLGIDVLQVAKQFQPDIIFVDILLQKKNGYEVCQELKTSKEANHIPLVLMWSGFMDLDESKFKECGADDQLEKPFDADALRNIVKNLVKKTSSQDLAKYLVFPDVPSEEKQTPKQTMQQPAHREFPAEPTAPTIVPAAREATSATMIQSSGNTGASWNMESFDDIDEFKELTGALPEATPDENSIEPSYDIELTREAKNSSLSESEIEDSLDGFTEVQLKKLPVDGTTPQRVHQTSTNLREITKTNPEDHLSHSELLANVAMSEKDLKKLQIERTNATRVTSSQQPSIQAGEHQLTEEQLELIIRSQSKEIIEKIVWKLVPDLAEQLIKQELSRLIDDTKL